MKKYLSLILIISLFISLLPACSKENKESEPSEITTEELLDDAFISQLEDEDENAKLKTKKVEDSFFYGTWTATSEKATYMYGNVTITINENGTWDGNITEEDIHGKWEHKGKGLRLTSDVIPFNLVYSSNNNVILQETDDAVRVVLTRK